jgi:hypothetical protein
MKKIIFIPGFSGGKRDMYILKKVFKEFDILYFPYDTKLTENLEEYAIQLKNFVNELKLKKGEKVSIISFSAGGIIASYYTKFLDKSKVDKIVTVCSPFKGSYLANLFWKKRKGLQQIKLKSKFLGKLSKKELVGVKTKNFWCYLDFIVQGSSGRGTNPEHTLFFIHPFIQWWPPISYKIRKFLLS